VTVQNRSPRHFVPRDDGRGIAASSSRFILRHPAIHPPSSRESGNLGKFRASLRRSPCHFVLVMVKCVIAKERSDCGNLSTVSHNDAHCPLKIRIFFALIYAKTSFFTINRNYFITLFCDMLPSAMQAL